MITDPNQVTKLFDDCLEEFDPMVLASEIEEQDYLSDNNSFLALSKLGDLDGKELELHLT